MTRTPGGYMNMSRPSPFAELIRREVQNTGRNINILVVGKTQMRKSTTALKLAYDVDPDFDPERDMGIGDAEEYLRVINTDVNRRGRVKILDEAGVGAYHRNWYNFLNQAMSHLVQTFGYMGLVTIVVAPVSGFIDKDLRSMFDYKVEMIKKDDRNGRVTASVMQLQYNQDQDKIYRKYLHGYWPETDRRARVKRYRFSYPSEERLQRYFGLANRFKGKLAQDLRSRAREMREQKTKEEFDPDKVAADVEARREEFVKEYKGRTHVDLHLVKAEFGLGAHRAQQVKAKAEKKMGLR